jgi:hypothetical protein
MKLDVRSIIIDHFCTLTKGQSAQASLVDLFLFVILPFLAAVAANCTDVVLRTEAYNVSVTFFGIFIALLLNIQVAIFAIFQRKWAVSDDAIEAQVQEGVISVRRRLLGELNANISYLILVCFVALVLSLWAYVAELNQGMAPLITVFLYVHFLLTILMVVKRAHALFQQQYRQP